MEVVVEDGGGGVEEGEGEDVEEEIGEGDDGEEEVDGWEKDDEIVVGLDGIVEGDGGLVVGGEMVVWREGG